MSIVFLIRDARILLVAAFASVRLFGLDVVGLCGIQISVSIIRSQERQSFRCVICNNCRISYNGCLARHDADPCSVRTDTHSVFGDVLAVDRGNLQAFKILAYFIHKCVGYEHL